MYDMIVVGGGPAGMTAALYALRNGKQVLVIEKDGFGGQITHSPKVENYPGTLQMSGNEFADRMLEQIMAQGADIEIETVTAVETAKQTEPDRQDRAAGFLVRTEEGGAYEAAAVVLATGVKHRMLGLPGEDELVGEGISFCAVCDGDFYAGKTVCVAGGGNSALQEAILLAEKCREVILLQDLPQFTGEEKLQEVLFARPNVRGLTGVQITGFETAGETLTGVRIVRTQAEGKGRMMLPAEGTADNGGASPVEKEEHGRGEETILCDGLFVAIGLIPENEPFADLAALDIQGYFDADEQCLTKTPGIFVAGDCRRKAVRQLTTAAADGAVAALAACRYMNDDIRVRKSK